MELLVVMSIMLVVSTILVAGYFGMTRAASYTAAETDVFNHLQLARQRASLDGTRVFFLLIDSNSYVLVHGAGTLTKDMDSKTFGGRHRFYDAYADLQMITNDASRVRVWNMDKNVYGDDVTIDPAGDETLETYPGSSSSYVRETCEFEAKLPAAAQYAKWKKGDRYGFELYPRLVLPKGFLFDLGSEKSLTIVFNPDGTSGRVDKSGTVLDQSTTISIFERIAMGNDKNTVKIAVGADGSIVPGA